MTNEIYHHGILGQRWYEQNGPPYPLGYARRSAAERRLNRKDMRYVKRVEGKARKKAYNASKKELKDYEQNVIKNKYPMKNSSGKLNSNYVNAYNKKMAELMNKNVDVLVAPSGRVIQFVAKRKEVGVYTALADPNYNMDFVRNGVYLTGKIAYKQSHINISNG